MVKDRFFLRRLSVCLVLLLTLSVGMWAAGQQEQEEKSEGSVTLSFFFPDSPGVMKGFTSVAEEYMKINPDVTVELRAVPWAKYAEQLQVMWLSNKVDDIILPGAPEVSNFAFYEALLPLDDILPADEYSQFIDSAISAVTYNGAVYAYPWRDSAVGMYYNKDLFDAAGIVAPTSLDEAWTWEEWVENITIVVEIAEKAQGKKVWGLTFLNNPAFGDFWCTPFIRTAGTPGSNTFAAISADGTGVRGYADTAEALEAYQFFQDLYTKYKLAPNAQIPDAFGTGQTATFVSFVQSGSLLENKFPDLNWGVMPLPYHKTPLSHTGGFSLAVSARSENPNEAKDFVKFAGSEEGIKIFFETSGSSLLARKSIYDDYPEYFSKDYQKMFIDILLNSGVERPKTPAYVIYNATLGKIFPDLAYGADVKATVESAMKEFETQVKKFK